MTRDEATQSLKALLWELPAEFSDGPPDIKGEGRETFFVTKKSNVRRVHQALWELQTYFGLQEDE